MYLQNENVGSFSEIKVLRNLCNEPQWITHQLCNKRKTNMNFVILLHTPWLIIGLFSDDDDHLEWRKKSKFFSVNLIVSHMKPKIRLVYSIIDWQKNGGKSSYGGDFFSSLNYTNYDSPWLTTVMKPGHWSDFLRILFVAVIKQTLWLLSRPIVRNGAFLLKTKSKQCKML